MFLSACVQVHVTLTELDVTMMVEKRELTSLKLIKCGVDVAMASIPPLAGQQALEVVGQVEDLILRDLQVLQALLQLSCGCYQDFVLLAPSLTCPMQLDGV